MYESAKAIRQQETHSWTWNLVPLLIVTVALSGLLLPSGQADPDAAAAEAPSVEAPSPMYVITPSPQPGIGEPELTAEDLPQSY
jgi:hypothetical protein